MKRGVEGTYLSQVYKGLEGEAKRVFPLVEDVMGDSDEIVFETWTKLRDLIEIDGGGVTAFSPENTFDVLAGVHEKLSNVIHYFYKKALDFVLEQWFSVFDAEVEICDIEELESEVHIFLNIEPEMVALLQSRHADIVTDEEGLVFFSLDKECWRVLCSSQFEAHESAFRKLSRTLAMAT